MTNIPLHSLIVVANVPGQISNRDLLTNIPGNVLVDFDAIRLEIAGRADNHLYDGAVWQEAYKRINLKLEHGQTVIVWGASLQPRDVDQFVQIADKWGTRLFWVLDTCVDTNHRMFTTYDQVCKKIKKSHKGHVLVDNWNLVAPSYQQLPNKILAVGDVHGNYASMMRVLETAKTEQRFIVWLGDVLDYGNQNLRCIRLAYDTVAQGYAHMIWGNHERKISKWISSNWGQNFRGKLSEANLATINEIQALPADSLTRFHSAWMALENWSTQHWVVDKFLFTHGAATPEMWNMHKHRLSGVHSERAYFGEVQDDRAKTAEGYPVRTWDWVNSVPNNHTVVVGHDWLDHDNCRVTIKQGHQGGQVICVDTGSGKGGRLGGVAIDLQTQTWEERYFDT